jgi:hypothetical protein
LEKINTKVRNVQQMLTCVYLFFLKKKKVKGLKYTSQRGRTSSAFRDGFVEGPGLGYSLGSRLPWDAEWRDVSRRKLFPLFSFPL